MKDRTFHRGENAYSKILYDKSADIFIGCGQKFCLTVLSKQTSIKIMECRAAEWTYTCMVLCKPYDVVFFGTNTGSIVMHLWPLDDS